MFNIYQEGERRETANGNLSKTNIITRQRKEIWKAMRKMNTQLKKKEQNLILGAEETDLRLRTVQATAVFSRVRNGIVKNHNLNP